jgi:hypothetical protein
MSLRPATSRTQDSITEVSLPPQRHFGHLFSITLLTLRLFGQLNVDFSEPPVKKNVDFSEPPVKKNVDFSEPPVKCSYPAPAWR